MSTTPHNVYTADMEPPLHKLPHFHRQVRFEAIGTSGQKTLASSAVLVVGLGGLGSWVAELLARCGVGRLVLLDDDVVDFSNLARQAMYDDHDARLRRNKVQAAADHLHRILPAGRVEPLLDRLREDNAESLLADIDAVADGTDNWASRFILNDAAVRTNTPWVHAGVVRAGGQVLSILPRRTACLRCLYEAPPEPKLEEQHRAATAGVLGPAVASIASLQAMEVLKLLLGRYDHEPPRLSSLELWAGTVRQLRPAKRRPDCPACGVSP